MSESTATIPTIDQLLEQSDATEKFRAAVKELELSGRADDVHIKFNVGAPAVKVLRTISQLLDQYSDWKVDGIQLNGSSGCSDFRGELNAILEDGTVKPIVFIWDCAWKANQEGMKNFFGDPDQQKAAAKYGYQCFEKFELKA